MTNQSVLIAGGGLAGLGLAHQLTQRTPGIKITVLEKARFPRPLAVAKVGESTVEIGSHYLAQQLDLQQHLEAGQLKKFGIRMFFGTGAGDFAEQDELGASQTFGLPTYQIDRGVLENHLAERLIAAGVTIIDDANIEHVVLGTPHTIRFLRNGQPQSLAATWFIDAAGRASILKRQLALAAANHHKGNAFWFRIDRKVVLDTWSESDAWRERCTPRGERWRSTNHLTGPGYWVWIIPLATGLTSIGIVMDDSAHAAAKIDGEARARQWLGLQHPRLAEAIEGAKFLDFVSLEDYSYDCKQVFSADRWAIVGEAGVFADPFYSPGSDFIAISNTMLAELINSDAQGKDIRLGATVFEKIYQSIYRNTLSLYTDQYGGFGDRIMMGVKLLWDYSYYWGVLCLLYFRGAFADFHLIRAVSPLLLQAQELNERMQQLFQTRAQQRRQLPACGAFMDQYQIPCLRHFNQILLCRKNGDLAHELQQNLHVLAEVSEAATDMLSDNPKRQISDSERAILGEYRSALRLFE